MAKIMTQDKCKERFAETMRQLAIDLDKIDKETPATPTTEPDWWVDMMDIQRTAFTYAEAYKKKDPN